MRVIFDGEPLSEKLASVQRKTVRKPYLEEAKKRLDEESNDDNEVVRGVEVQGGSDDEDSSDDSDYESDVDTASDREEAGAEDKDDPVFDEDGDVVMQANEKPARKKVTVGELSWKKLAAGAVSLTDELMCVVQLALARAGINFLVAPNEADSQVAGGGADFRMTTDSDHIILYHKTNSTVIVMRRPTTRRPSLSPPWPSTAST